MPSYAHQDVEIGILTSSEIIYRFFQVTFGIPEHYIVSKKKKPELGPHDKYTVGRVGHHWVVLASIDEVTDQASATVLALRFSEHCPQLKVVFLVGVCGAVPTDTEGMDIMLGDIIIGKSVVQHGFGRMYPDGFARKDGAEDQPVRQGHRLRSFVAKLESLGKVIEEKTEWHLGALLRKRGNDGLDYPGLHEDCCFISSYGHRHHGAQSCLCAIDSASCHAATQSSCEELGCEPQYLRARKTHGSSSTRHPALHFGSIASGDVVIQHAAERDQLAKSSSIIGIDRETAAVWEFVPCIPIKAVCHYADGHRPGNWEPYAAAVATACAWAILELWDRPPVPPSQGQAMLLHHALGHNGGQISTQASRMDGKDALNLLRAYTAIFDQLPYAADADLNHYDRQHEPTCLEGTRTTVLNDVYKWADNEYREVLYWLTGWVGTGKSTISRTVARKLGVRHGLTLTCSFDKVAGGGKRSAREFITTIAYKLGIASPGLRAFISQIVAQDPYVCNQSLDEQCRKLILGTISMARSVIQQLPIVLIVDALDNCETSEMGIVIRLLGDISSAGVRVFISSRMTPTIAFHRRSEHNGRFRACELQDIPREIIDQDILLFFRRELQQLNTNWEEGDNLRQLVEKTEGSFLWASMAVRYIREVPGLCGRRLSMLLKSGTTISPIEAQFDDMYLGILSDAMPSNLSSEESSIYYGLLRRYLGVIVVLFGEIAPASFYELIDPEEDGPGADGIDVHEVLKNLQPIMDVPDDRHNKESLIRLHHPHLSSFFTIPTRCTDERFLVDPEQAHYDALHGCLKLLSGVFERSQNETGDLSSDQRDHMIDTEDACTVWEWSPAARYACHYWVRHLKSSGAEVHPGDPVSLFVKNHVICWLEALVQMGSTDEALKDLECLASSISDTQAYEFGTSLRELSRSFADRRAQIEQDHSMINQLTMKNLDRYDG